MDVSYKKIWSQIQIILQSRVYAAEKQFFKSQKRAAESKPVGRHSPDPKRKSPDPGSGHGEAGTYSTVHPSGREVGQTARSGNPTPEKQATSKAEY